MPTNTAIELGMPLVFWIKFKKQPLSLYLYALLWVGPYTLFASPADDPLRLANEYLGIPYREDGARDHKGTYTTFSDQGLEFSEPGLNCSGLVVEITHRLFNQPIFINEAIKDRQEDSGRGAELGEDWDFGLDLILNLTEQHSRRVILPFSKPHTLIKNRGFNLHDHTLWQEVIPQFRPSRVYYAVISKPYRQRGYKLIYYHVAVIIPDNNGHVWLYHATKLSGTHRIDLSSKKGFKRFHYQFAPSRFGAKYIYILEVPLS